VQRLPQAGRTAWVCRGLLLFAGWGGGNGEVEDDKQLSPKVRWRAFRMVREHRGDRGCQYLSIACIEGLKDAGVDPEDPQANPGIGSVGYSFDNALAKTVDRFCTRRLLAPIGNIPPAEAEARCYGQIEQRSAAASLKRYGVRQTRGGSLRRRATCVPVHLCLPSRRRCASRRLLS
jgi:hypothetical protein